MQWDLMGRQVVWEPEGDAHQPRGSRGLPKEGLSALEPEREQEEEGKRSSKASLAKPLSCPPWGQSTLNSLSC